MAKDEIRVKDNPLKNATMGGPGKRMFAPIEKPKHMRKTLVRLWSYVREERKLFILVFFLVVLGNAALLTAPYLITRAVDTIALGLDLDILLGIVIVLVLAYLIDGILTIMQGFIMAKASQRVIRSLRDNLFQKLLKLPIVFFDTNTHGELMSRLTNDIENVSTTISSSSVQLMHALITVIGSFGMMLYLSPLMTLGAMVTLPLVLLLTRLVAKNTAKLYKAQQKELGILNGYIEENITGFEVLKAFSREEESLVEFDTVNERLKTVGLRAQVISGTLMPIMNVINNLGYTTIAFLGGYLGVRGIISIGVIAGFLSYSRQFTRPLTDIASIFNILQSAIAGAERVFEILDEAEEEADSHDAVALNEVRGEVEFRNVSFHYNEGEPVLKDVSFRCEAGQSVALVGPTGAGKTTIVNLVSRFYDPKEGSILIDGYDTRQIRREDLRRVFGIVLQDTYLFSGTIRDNIAYSRIDATMEDIIASARLANCHDFIMRLPKGYDTQLSESGSTLSEGERQLIAIARAILKDPSILILDEATSSVDTRTELRIQEAMVRVMAGRTSFIIAHRLSTIREADVIMVINGGEIVERGSHAELLREQGFYFRMYASQFSNKGEDEVSSEVGRKSPESMTIPILGNEER
jgi:ATP-binding cassette subfamily B protein